MRTVDTKPFADTQVEELALQEIAQGVIDIHLRINMFTDRGVIDFRR